MNGLQNAGKPFFDADAKALKNGSGGGTRTPDTRIMIPVVSDENQSLACKQASETPHMNQMDGDGGVNHQSPFGGRAEWLYCPTFGGEMRFHKERFEAMLARQGVTKGTPPKLPSWCKEVGERTFKRLLSRGAECWTYFARGIESGRIKIGKSKDPHRRVTQLPYCAFGERAELVALLRGEDFEWVYHRAFEQWREGHEWFAPHPDILAEIERLNAGAAIPRQRNAALGATKGRFVRHVI